LVIVHNHFRPGGVRRVIEQVTPHLAKAVRAREILLATGEAPDPSWLGAFRRSLGNVPVTCHTEKAFAYLAEQRSKPALISNRLRAVLEQILREPCLVWAHNQGLARNLLLTRELNRICAQRHLPLVFHHHDWWFDNRWQRRREMAGFRTLQQIAQTIFTPNACHAAINQSDAKILRRHFRRRAAWLPNPVAHQAPLPAPKTRAWLHRQIGEDAPIWLMPCRLLRRKNIAEALLLTRWLRPEAWLVTTGGISSADEQSYAHKLKAAAHKFGWRLRLGVLEEKESAKPSVSALLAASEAVLLTSCQEGFGLPYLEAATARRPLICRALPNITPDLARFGLRFPQNYAEILIHPRLFGWNQEQLRQKALFEQFRRQLPRPCHALAGTPALLKPAARPSPVPFSRLTLTAQLEVLAHPPEFSWDLCLPSNPFLLKWRKLAPQSALKVSHYPQKASRFLSGAAYARRFLTLLAAQPQPAAPRASLAVQDEFIREKLRSENLYPLTWAPRT
jgi:glycosyltransferase involved in cell wall biosynthesis